MPDTPSNSTASSAVSSFAPSSTSSPSLTTFSNAISRAVAASIAVGKMMLTVLQSPSSSAISVPAN